MGVVIPTSAMGQAANKAMPDAYVATDGLLRHSITSTRELFVHSHSRNGPCRVEVEPIFMQRSEFYNRYSSLRK